MNLENKRKMAKINWSKARADYLKDKSQTFNTISQKYGVNVKSVERVALKEKWFKKRGEVEEKTREKEVEKIAESISEINARHVKSGRILENEGLRAIVSGGMKPTSYKDARLSVLTGVSIQRKALGLTKKEVQDEIAQKFSQFTFIFNLTPD